MNPVGAAPGDGRDIAWRAVLRGVSYALHANLGDSLHRWEQVAVGAIAGDVGDRDAIHAGLGQSGQAALDREAVAIIRLHAGKRGDQVVGCGIAAGAHIAGQVYHLERAERFGDGRGIGGDHAGGRLHLYRFGNVPNLQSGVHAQGLARNQGQIAHGECPKAGPVNGD